MINKKYSSISILLSCLYIFSNLIINYKIALRYESITDGKTMALFGLVEYFNFFYQYYFIILILLSILFLIFEIFNNELF